LHYSTDRQLLRDLFLGFIHVHILFHAAEEPVFGISLMAELERHGFRIGPGTLYSILHRLERQGCLRRDGQVVNGKPRQYYRIAAAWQGMLVRVQAQIREPWARCIPGRHQGGGAA